MHMHMHAHACICMHVHACICMHAYACMHACICMHMHAYHRGRFQHFAKSCPASSGRIGPFRQVSIDEADTGPQSPIWTRIGQERKDILQILTKTEVTEPLRYRANIGQGHRTGQGQTYEDSGRACRTKPELANQWVEHSG